MKLFKIVKDNATSIRGVSKPIEKPYDQETIQLLKDMVDYLKCSQEEKYIKKYHLREGIGLAAPQIGKNIRAFAIYYKEANENGEEVETQYGLINPEIISESVKMCALRGGEGCLSVDADHEGYVYRHYKILLKAYDVFLEKEIVITARGFDAIVLQHEYDHLNGVLFYDHIDKSNPFKHLENSVLI